MLSISSSSSPSLLRLRWFRFRGVLVALLLVVVALTCGLVSKRRRQLVTFPTLSVRTTGVTKTVKSNNSNNNNNTRDDQSVADAALLPNVSTTITTRTNMTLPRYEIVVTLLHDNSQNWKKESSEQGSFLLLPEIQDIPVTICSPDKLIGKDVFLTQDYFRPEADHIFGRITINRSGPVTFLPMINGGRAQEVPGYLTYILHHYDDLPDAVIFLHANPTGHGEHVFRNIRHVVDHWTPAQIGFLHLNEGAPVCRPGGTEGPWPTYWRLLGFHGSYLPAYVKVPCCAQFIVTRERILLRSKWFYQQLMKLAYNSADGAFSEHYWHIFFGESAILSDDREVQTYFHSNWTKPVRDAVLHNPYPNVPFNQVMKPWYEQSIADPNSYYPKLSSDREITCPPGSQYRR